MICRDRAGAYAEGARSGAPQARQVADAWQLLHNLAEAVEKTVGAHHPCIRKAFTTPAAVTECATAPSGTAEPPVEEASFVLPDGTRDVLGHPRRLVARTTERYTAVQQLLSEGKSLAAIGRRLRLDHSTVRRFARARSLDEHKPYLHRRWREGCHDIPQLHCELRAHGFTGDIQCVRRYFRPFQEAAQPQAEEPANARSRAEARPETPAHRPLDHDPPRTPRRDRRCRAQRDPGRLPTPRRHRTPCPRLRRHDARPARQRPARMDGPRPHRRPARSAFPGQRNEEGPGRGHRRPVYALELWPGRGTRDQSQVPQAHGLRPRLRT